MAVEETGYDWASFDEAQAVEYIKALRASGAKDTAVARRIYALRQFFKFLRKKGVTAADPFGDMERHATQRKLPRMLSINGMNRLLTCIRQPLPVFLGLANEEVFLMIRDRSMLETLYSSALRVSELCGANWQDIDWSKRR